MPIVYAHHCNYFYKTWDRFWFVAFSVFFESMMQDGHPHVAVSNGLPPTCTPFMPLFHQSLFNQCWGHSSAVWLCCVCKVAPTTTPLTPPLLHDPLGDPGPLRGWGSSRILGPRVQRKICLEIFVIFFRNWQECAERSTFSSLLWTPHYTVGNWTHVFQAFFYLAAGAGVGEWGPAEVGWLGLRGGPFCTALLNPLFPMPFYTSCFCLFVQPFCIVFLHSFLQFLFALPFAPSFL